MSIPTELERKMKEEKFWSVELFKQEGFERQRCPKCGHYFWSIGKKDTCGEPPCGTYSFIGNPLGKTVEIDEMERRFLKWFEKNGHTIVNRYPVVARWKPDTFFTGASIYCFQPFIVSGEVVPPANPLVIAQPSVRFVDIENVGLGTGRHLTSFTMGGHHAFNNKKEIYWKDRTVELCYNFFTDEVKIPPEEIVFKESWWEGGGNAGPCFEIIVRGNEVATLVFMEYQLKNGLKRMNTRVIDTGYGLERIVWLSKGTKTIYDAVFPEFVGFLKNLVGDESRKSLHNIYQLVDHTKTIMFILGDGVVPSNVQEGYLARLLIRRSERAIRNLGLDLTTYELVERQIQMHRKRYPEFWDNRDSILKLVKVEEEKYQETLKRGQNIVRKIVADLKKEGESKIDQETLITLYDSHGLLPSDVQRFAGEFPVEKIDDTEAKIAVRKEAPMKKDEKKIDVDVTGVPETEKIFYKPIYEWKAKVLKVNEQWIILDKTAFYPRGGGQEPDHGIVIGQSGTFNVIDVEKMNNVVLHRVDKSGLSVGEEVLCKIDIERRKQLTQHHTATHLVNAACRQVVGNWVWQHSAYKDVDKARLDITHYTNLTDEEIEKIQSQVKRWIKDNLKVEKSFLLRNEAEKKYGFRLYQGGVPIGREIRVVSIDNIDHEACGGTHCDYTGEIEEFMILDTERVQDGVIRINFVAGERAKQLIKENERIISEIEKILNVGKDEIIDKVEKLLEKAKKKEKEVKKRIREDILKMTDNLLGKFANRDGVEYLIEAVDGDMNILKEISKELTKENTLIILVGKTGDKIFLFASRGPKVNVNVGLLVKKVCDKFGGKGGGNETTGQGILSSVNINELREFIWKIK